MDENKAIEVTPEMLRAGKNELALNSDPCESVASISYADLEAVYTAMRLLEPAAQGHIPTTYDSHQCQK